MTKSDTNFQLRPVSVGADWLYVRWLTVDGAVDLHVAYSRHGPLGQDNRSSDQAGTQPGSDRNHTGFAGWNEGEGLVLYSAMPWPLDCGARKNTAIACGVLG